MTSRRAGETDARSASRDFAHPLSPLTSEVVPPSSSPGSEPAALQAKARVETSKPKKARRMSVHGARGGPKVRGGLEQAPGARGQASVVLTHTTLGAHPSDQP